MHGPFVALGNVPEVQQSQPVSCQQGPTGEVPHSVKCNDLIRIADAARTRRNSLRLVNYG